jgi:hypothetical protein
MHRTALEYETTSMNLSEYQTEALNEDIEKKIRRTVGRTKFENALPVEIALTELWMCSTFQLLCPVCKFEYVHHLNISVVIDGKDEYAASKCVRGSVIAIPMYCEDGHNFVYCLGFHKGNVKTWCLRTKVNFWKLTLKLGMKDR